MTRSLAVGALTMLTLALGGCLERRMYITSEPQGARVWVNDVELGRTPVEADFEYYGVYDVRLTHDGFEPLVTSARAAAPFHEKPGIDFFTTIAPVRFKNEVRWHFVLTPALETTQERPALESGLLERAGQLRNKAN